MLQVVDRRNEDYRFVYLKVSGLCDRHGLQGRGGLQVLPVHVLSLEQVNSFYGFKSANTISL